MAHQHKKELVGIVISNKMKNTIVVEVTRLVQHPQYKKVIKQWKKFVAHDEKAVAKVGDKVRIQETRPMSRTKRWILAEVIAAAS